MLFTLWGRPIHLYGVMAALGFAAALVHWTFQGRRQGRPRGFGSDLAAWLALGGLLGARAAYVAAHWAHFRSAPGEILRIDQGGLIYYGGFLGGVAAAVLFSRVRRLPPWDTGDFAITGLPLAHAFGRVGCFFNGCCYGRATGGAAAVWMEGARRHPVQLYEAAANLLVYAALALYARRRPRAGTVLALYLTLYPAARFLLEYLRGDRRLAGPGLNEAQWISLALLAAGAGLWRLRGAPRSCPSEP